MKHIHSWTPAQAKADFDQLLDAAKNQGNQQISDDEGSFIIQFTKRKAREPVTDFLSKGLQED
ncbi:hypothetical protein RMS29_014955 [Agrobacterium rosae]|uniref:Uncharacterized protein n=1 Tax=Agrobacterium rosae TaxID=1972867 RepID=A0ABU4W4K4_9HYPH|nr:hypothetical protein [Agrobacterium rosae]MDX8332710.1 hypothetical protein [Agrobacterium rosae]